MTTLSREALYDLVWTSPTRTVAETFGVSDVWLKKVCARAGIPTPDRGYWAKRAAGRLVVTARLPLREPGMPNEVSITTPVSNWPFDPVAELAEPIPEPPLFSGSLEDVKSRVIKRVGKVIRCRDLATPSPMVRRILASDEKRRENQRSSSFPSSWDTPLFESPFELRRLRVLNAIGLALPRVGGSLDYSGKEARALSAKVGDRRIEVALDHPSAKPSRWGEWSTRPGPIDILKLELKPRFIDGTAKVVWIDGEDGKLEDQLTEIVVTMACVSEAQYRQGAVAHHAYLLKRRSENEAELAKRRAEAERQVRERRIKVQQERRDRLLGQSNAWRMAQDIRSFVANVLQGRGDPGAELRSWVNWAHAEADALDPTLNGSLTPADITPADDPSSRVEAPARGCAAGYDQGSRS